MCPRCLVFATTGSLCLNALGYVFNLFYQHGGPNTSPELLSIVDSCRSCIQAAPTEIRDLATMVDVNQRLTDYTTTYFTADQTTDAINTIAQYIDRFKDKVEV